MRATLSPNLGANTITTTDEDNGEYTVSYTLRTADDYTVSIVVGTAPLEGFPLDTTVVPGTDARDGARDACLREQD